MIKWLSGITVACQRDVHRGPRAGPEQRKLISLSECFVIPRMIREGIHLGGMSMKDYYTASKTFGKKLGTGW